MTEAGKNEKYIEWFPCRTLIKKEVNDITVSRHFENSNTTKFYTKMMICKIKKHLFRTGESFRTGENMMKFSFSIKLQA